MTYGLDIVMCSYVIFKFEVVICDFIYLFMLCYMHIYIIFYSGRILRSVLRYYVLRSCTPLLFLRRILLLTTLAASIMSTMEWDVKPMNPREDASLF